MIGSLDVLRLKIEGLVAKGGGFRTFSNFHDIPWEVDVRSCWPMFMSAYTSLLYQMHVRTSGTLVHNFLQNQEVFPYQFSFRDRVCFLKIAACKFVEIFTGVNSLVHATQHCPRCERITKGLSGAFTDLTQVTNSAAGSLITTCDLFTLSLAVYHVTSNFQTSGAHGARKYLHQCKF